jgi:hypothetical protein
MRRAGVLLAAAALGGCIDNLDAGEFGTLRYFGEVRGERPLRLVPPIADRAGNAYVLYGARTLSEVEASVGLAEGGWAGGCTIHEADDRGLHGWVGAAEDRAWYWSGDALVEVSGQSGGCESVADRDPATNADLAFLGVAPWVREAPSRTTLVAMVQSPADLLPFEGIVDLDTRRTVGLRRFAPEDAAFVEVLGTGADASRGLAVFLVRYRVGDVVFVEGIFLDEGGNRVAVASIDGAGYYGEDAVVGSLHFSKSGLVAGLLEDGDLVVFGRDNGYVTGAGGSMTPVGVHGWGGDLWLVGTGGGKPMVAPLGDDGSPGQARVWEASERAARRLNGPVTVLDDRTEPRVWVSWDQPGTAMGAFPLLSEHAPARFAEGTTGWLVAGPYFEAGGETHTSVAFGPVGITYP